jgi:undecaprenyl-diphosphatase
VSPKAPASKETVPAKRARVLPVVLKLSLPRALGQNAARNIALWSWALRPAARRASTPPLSRKALAGVVLAIAAAVASMFLLDRQAADWASQLPQGFRNAFEAITNGGLSGWFLYPLGIASLCLAMAISPSMPRLSRGVLAAVISRFLFLFWAIATPGLFSTIIKRLIGRARPYVDVHDNPFTYMPFAWRPEYASLPSGHATTVASVAVAFGALWPRARPVLWLYALVIMFSRVVVMAHHPSDVVAGAVVGAAGAALIRRFFAARRLLFCARNLKPYPAPSLRRIGRALTSITLLIADCSDVASSRSEVTKPKPVIEADHEAF